MDSDKFGDTKTKQHFYWLDLLRFVAAFLVVAQHTRTLLFPKIYDIPSEGLLQQGGYFVFYLVTRFAHYWVLLFFVLSGFLVGGKAIDNISKKTFDVRNYFIDRFVRIMLPLITALIVIFICNTIMGIQNQPLELIGNLLSLQGIFVKPVSGPLWSLSYEVWLYILMGVGGMFTMASTNKSKIINFILLVVVTMSFLQLNYVYGVIWFMGAIAYRNIAEKPCRLLIQLFVSLTLLMLAMALFIEKYYEWALPIIELLFSLFLALFLQQIVRCKPKGKIANALNAWGVKLAVFSYTLYLTHYPLIYLINYLGISKFEKPTWYAFGVYMAIVIFCTITAYLIYLVSEKHTAKVKIWIKKII